MTLETRTDNSDVLGITPAQFSERATRTIGKVGLLVYPLGEESIGSLIDSGRKIIIPRALARDGELSGVDVFSSRAGQVAIDPQRFMEQQPTDVTIPGTQRVTARIADLASLAFQHLDQTGQQLFTGKFARSQEWFGGALVMGVRFADAETLEIGYSHPGIPSYREFEANSWWPTLMVPKGA